MFATILSASLRYEQEDCEEHALGVFRGLSRSTTAPMGVFLGCVEHGLVIFLGLSHIIPSERLTSPPHIYQIYHTLTIEYNIRTPAFVSTRG